jgi:pantoate--beta-alanine ligase
MQVFTNTGSLQDYLSALNPSVCLGFVPTMGALHEGHLTLVQASLKQCDVTVVSIFVNPTQFDRKEDLDKYPSSLHRDLILLEKEGCQVVFIPDDEQVYGDKVERKIFDFAGLDKVMEGAHRPGHFDGVWTVVRKLFNIVRPDKAFFGEKDFQQLQIIRHRVEKEGIPVKIIGLPIVREADGLALSSRNRRLSLDYRAAAPFIYRTLKAAKKRFGTENVSSIMDWVRQEFDQHPLLELEYFSIARERDLQEITGDCQDEKCRAFIAVFAGTIRLIDNLPLY